jgi:hypothetical protein
MIWVRDGMFTWLADAWDDDTVSENHYGWEAKVRETRNSYPEVRIVVGTVNMDIVRGAFKIPDAGELVVE